MERTPLTKKSLLKDLDEGMNRKQIGEKYGLSQGQIKLAVEAMGIEKVRPSTRKFVIVPDEEEIVEQIPTNTVESVVVIDN